MLETQKAFSVDEWTFRRRRNISQTRTELSGIVGDVECSYRYIYILFDYCSVSVHNFKKNKQGKLLFKQRLHGVVMDF